jgi:ketosteroid isomerase-like protein
MKLVTVGRYLPFLLLALACASPAGPADQEEALRATLARYDSTWMAKDSAAIDALLAPEYLYFSSTGELSRKENSLAFLADTSYALISSRRTEVEILIDGAVARVSSRWEGRGRFQGRTVDDDQTCGLTWIRRDGRWLLFTEHCVGRTGRDTASTPAG